MPAKSELVVLIGPMGVGKTTIGKKLARALGLPFRDTDALVVAKHGPIPEIFETQGEAVFRRYEEEELALALESPAVIATGGGAVMSVKNQSAMKSASVFYLSTDGRHMASRLANGNRPLLKNGIEDWRRIYSERKPVYELCADFEINTSTQTLASALEEIKQKLGRND
jgi:shikimate kinase